MESYVEITFLHNFGTLLLSFAMASYCNVQPIPWYKMVIYAFVISAMGSLVFFKGSIWLILLVEILFLLMFYKTWKSWLMMQVIRCLWYMSAFGIYQGSFHNLLWFVPIHKPVVWLWIFYALLFLLLKVKWKDMLARSHYCYYVQFILHNKKIKVKGFLDSGNLMVHEGLPVLFISSKYEAYFKEQDIKWIVINTVQDTSLVCAYMCNAALEGCQSHKVLVCCKKEIRLPLNCEVLLNMNVMTLG